MAGWYDATIIELSMPPLITHASAHADTYTENSLRIRETVTGHLWSPFFGPITHIKQNIPLELGVE